MINDFTDIFTLTITFRDLVANLLVALLCGIIISLVYRNTYKGLNYSASFAVSMVMLTMITSIVIMVIGNNLARAFGMVGAMSIIRFRTAVKDASDIMFIFFALTIGLACGVKLYTVAIFGTLFISAVFMVLSYFSFGVVKRKEYLLQILTGSTGPGESVYEPVIRKHCTRFKLVNTKILGEPDNETMELSYHVLLKNRDEGTPLVTEIKAFPEVKHVNLFFDEN
jgi:uncharacterized membrane protein YhiD involved in acid resistance